MSNANSFSKNSQTSAVPEIPPGPVPAPAPRQAVGIPDPPLSAAVSEETQDVHHATPYQIVTDRIVGLLEAGVVPWKASWVRQGYQPAQSLVTRKPYRGINRLLLGVIAHLQGYSSPYWVTYRQASELGGHVRKGEKGCPCFFWKVYDGKNTEEDAPANDVSDKDQKRFVARYYTVFSLDQCEGIEAPPAPQAPLPTFEPVAACEQIVAGFHGPGIDQGNYDPCYLPSLDRVRVPAPKWFNSAEDYYASLFHELGHSTGHPTRLGRFSSEAAAPFASHEYSKEELIAELASAFLCAEAGIATRVLDDQAAYIAGWLHVLKNDNRLVVMAAAQAEKAADLILGRKPEGATTA